MFYVDYRNQLKSHKRPRIRLVLSQHCVLSKKCEKSRSPIKRSYFTYGKYTSKMRSFVRQNLNLDNISLRGSNPLETIDFTI